MSPEEIRARALTRAKEAAKLSRTERGIIYIRQWLAGVEEALLPKPAKVEPVRFKGEQDGFDWAMRQRSAQEFHHRNFGYLG